MALFEDKIVHIEGLNELDTALSQLPRATSRGVLLRVLRKRSKPIVSAAKSGVRVRTGTLKNSIAASTKLSRRQASLHRKLGSQSGVELFIGAGPLVQAITEEFGTVDQEPHPFMRPAWDLGRDALLAGIASDLWLEIEASARRANKKTAKG